MHSTPCEKAENDASYVTRAMQRKGDISDYLSKSMTSFEKIQGTSKHKVSGPHLPMFHLTSAYQTYHYKRAICNLLPDEQRQLRAEEFPLPLNTLWRYGHFQNISAFRDAVAEMLGAMTLDNLRDIAQTPATGKPNDERRASVRVIERMWYFYAPDMTERELPETAELTEEEEYHKTFLDAPRGGLERIIASERGKLRSLDSEADFDAFKDVLFDFDPTTLKPRWVRWRDEGAEWWDDLLDLELRVVTRPFRSLIHACRFYHKRTYYGFTYLLDFSSLFEIDNNGPGVLKGRLPKEGPSPRKPLRRNTPEEDITVDSLLNDQFRRESTYLDDPEAPVPMDFEYESPRKINWSSPEPLRSDRSVGNPTSLPPTSPESQWFPPMSLLFMLNPELEELPCNHRAVGMQEKRPVASWIALPAHKEQSLSGSNCGGTENFDCKPSSITLDVKLSNSLPRTPLKRPSPEVNDASKEYCSPSRRTKTMKGSPVCHADV